MHSNRCSSNNARFSCCIPSIRFSSFCVLFAGINPRRLYLAVLLQDRVIRLEAGYWGLKLIAWIHMVLGARAVLPWNPKRQKRRDRLPPT
jgi:hypothetical protein